MFHSHTVATGLLTELDTKIGDLNPIQTSIWFRIFNLKFQEKSNAHTYLPTDLLFITYCPNVNFLHETFHFYIESRRNQPQERNGKLVQIVFLSIEQKIHSNIILLLSFASKWCIWLNKGQKSPEKWMMAKMHRIMISPWCWIQVDLLRCEEESVH